MKTCSKCKLEKALDEFYNNRSTKDGKHQYCKSCFKEHNKTSYTKYRIDRVKRSREYYYENQEHLVQETKKAKLERKQIVLDHLQSHPCVDCGNTDVRVLEFDHVTGEKKFNISYLIKGRIPIKTLMIEIAKCEVVCANCHRIRTNSRVNSYRNLF